MTCIVKVVGRADGEPCPHDNRYVLRWNPHTEFGTCAIDTTDDESKARPFADLMEIHHEWGMISKVDPVRPDGKPNRPLTGLTIEVARRD